MTETKTDDAVVYTPGLIGEIGAAKAYVDGELRNITGVAGSFKFTGKIGELASFAFALKGFTTILPATESNPTVSLDENEKLLVQQATAITTGGAVVDLQSFELDAGMEVEQYYGSETLEYNIKDFKPTINIKAIKTKGNKAHWEELGTSAAIEVVILLESESGNQLEVKASFCSASNVSESEDKGIMIYEKTYLCESSIGGDNFSLTYK